MVLERRLARIATYASVGFSLGMLVLAAVLWLDEVQGQGPPPGPAPAGVGTFDRAVLTDAMAPAALPPAGDPLWAEVARDARVEWVVDDVLFTRDGVRTVDVTETLIERLTRGGEGAGP